MATLREMMTRHFHTAAHREALQLHLVSIQEQKTTLEKVVRDPDLMRSQGVARYGATAGGGSGVSNATQDIALTHLRTVEQMEQRYRLLTVRAVQVEADIAACTEQMVVVELALRTLDPQDLTIITSRYATPRRSCQWIATEVGLSESAVRYRLDEMERELLQLIEAIEKGVIVDIGSYNSRIISENSAEIGLQPVLEY